MKFLTLALGLLLTTCSSQAVMAQGAAEAFCKSEAGLIYEVALDRDEGIPVEFIYKALTAIGYTDIMAKQIITIVFDVLADRPPSEVADKYLQVCMNGFA